MVDHQGVLTLSRGSLRVVGSVFEVMTQVDLGLTTSAGLTQLIRSLELMTLIKNLGRHKPPWATVVGPTVAGPQGRDGQSSWPTMVEDYLSCATTT
jgi:hypothetical protein